MAMACEHMEHLQPLADKDRVCEDCVKIGGRWLHLRQCRICGHVGCCDSSPNRHATAHFAATGHPVVQSYEPGETWLWCYVDEVVGE
ncbi:MAG: UBP-type zinc finger domain-containing protein [Vicinamibacterales bacterium]